MRHLMIDGIAVPLRAGLQMRQIWQHEEAMTDERMADGSLRWQVFGAPKLQATFSASGIIPAPFDDPEWLRSAPRLVSCIRPRGVYATGAAPTVTIPAARRSDAGSEPYARAFIGEQVIRTPVAMAGNDATPTPVPGATRYQVLYFPEFSAHVRLQQIEVDPAGLAAWRLVAREV